MGREIRRVPKDWEHPKGKDGRFKPLHNIGYEQSARDWCENMIRWNEGSHPDCKQDSDCKFYWDWAGMPPDKEYYRPDWPEGTMVCYQIYESVSEGTPVSPVFETIQAVENWLVENWRVSLAEAKKFIELGGAPTFICSPNKGIKKGYESLEVEKGNDGQQD